jgi:aminopeptidase
MSSFEEKLEKYAELAVKVGVNVQPGQTLLVFADVESAPFTRKVVRQAYQAGAKHVYVDWGDDQVALTKYLLAPDEAFEEYPAWKAEGYAQLAREGCALLAIRSPNPDIFKDVDPNRIATSRKVGATATKEFSDYQMQRKIRWSIIAIPSEAWAEKVFPNVPVDEAVENLWDAIFKITRVDQPDVVAAWMQHIDTLKAKREELNAKNYKKLHYRAPGTELSIELPEGHVWYGGGGANRDGILSVANMPTEEVFTLPKRDGVNGTVRATMPLNYAGTVIDNFAVTFESGRIVDFSAEKGYENLKNIIETDEGSHFLGEVALVPVDSPISNSGLLFYETLFDENASCHLAIGRAYPCFKDADKMTEEDYAARGANNSLVHVDFMMGSPEMNIDGETEDGKLEPIFRNGNWA